MIREVSFQEILNEKELLREYSAECSLPEFGEASPQPAIYEAMEKGGMRCFGVFDRDRMVGFTSLLTYPVPHYGKTVLTTESIFVSRDHRAEFGQELLDFIEWHARQIHCAAVLYSAPTGSRFSKMLSLSPKYRHSNDIFLCNLA